MKFEFSGRVRYSEVDEEKRLTLRSLVNYFQDVSTFQSEHLGIGLEYLKERNLAWILSSWQIVVDHLPVLCEQVTSQTWPYAMKGFYGLRNFALLDGNGEMAAWANSVWVLFDMERQRPARVPELMLEKYVLSPKLEMDYAPRKMELPQNGKNAEPFFIGRHHLDTNHHVNNGQYIAMAEEYLPAGFRVGQMRAEYKMQARLHDQVVPVVSVEENRVTVGLCNGEGKPYAIVEYTMKAQSR